MAAVHSGILKPGETGVVKVTMLPDGKATRAPSATT